MKIIIRNSLKQNQTFFFICIWISSLHLQANDIYLRTVFNFSFTRLIPGSLLCVLLFIQIDNIEKNFQADLHTFLISQTNHCHCRLTFFGDKYQVHFRQSKFHEIYVKQYSVNNLRGFKALHVVLILSAMQFQAK